MLDKHSANCATPPALLNKKFWFLFLVFVVVLFIETGSLYIVLAILELIV